MAAFENLGEMAEAHRQGWLNPDTGKLTAAGRARLDFEASVTSTNDARDVCTPQPRYRVVQGRKR